MKGLPVVLPPNLFHRIKVLNVFNPFRDGYTGLFLLETLKPGVNTIVELF